MNQQILSLIYEFIQRINKTKLFFYKHDQLAISHNNQDLGVNVYIC